MCSGGVVSWARDNVSYIQPGGYASRVFASPEGVIVHDVSVLQQQNIGDWVFIATSDGALSLVFGGTSN